VYATRDGHLAISLSPLKDIAEALDEPRIAAFADRDTWSDKEAIGDLVAAALKTRTTAEWIARMEPLRIWHARVQDYADIVADPQVRHMRSLVSVPGVGKSAAPVTLVNHPLRYDGEAAEVRLSPQRLGAQTAEILGELGLAPREIDELRDQGVIKLAAD
jgi:crotonobetainyl-CoA:carnitine CoA-transferase CaiB-like acyl-CoA transferase